MKNLINFDSTDPKVIKRNKNILAIFCIIVIISLITFVVTLSSRNKKVNITTKKTEKIDITSSLVINPEDEWLSKSENEIKFLHEQNKILAQKLDELTNKQKESEMIYGQTIESLASQLARTEEQVSNNNYQTNNDYGQYNEYGELINNSSHNNIMTISIDLQNDNSSPDSENNFKDLDNYIPAGSYAKARMLSGADVSTGVNNQNDPNNMMFEIISPVYVPKYKGNIQEIKKIEGCRIMGAAVGQLWTEKAYIRLLKMTCSFEKGRVAEYKVKGYVTSFAKEGVRGKVVSREGYFTSMAFLAGAVEGLADVTKVAYSPTLEVSTGLATENIKSSDVAKQAGSSGLSKAAEILSEYYINRAEQYQSVIDVPTGIEVEIVFQDGVDLKTSSGFKVKQENNILEQNDIKFNTNVYNNGGVF